MSKKSISSLELAALINELQFLTNGKLTQIYHQEKKELLFKLHARGEGKKLLRIIPGKFLCLTEEKKESPTNPTGFCMQLRKYLSNATINKIYQKDAERICVFELEKSERFYLIIELFSKGNIVLTDDNWKIIGVLERQIWKDRIVKPHETYVFPESRTNWKTIKFEEFSKILHESEKKNLATTLATEIGLGGVYAEELCARGKVDKDLKPTEINVDQLHELFKVLIFFRKAILSTKGYIYEKEITSFPLTSQEPVSESETYNQAINTIDPFEKISPYQQKIAAVEKTIATQLAAIKKQEGLIAENTKKGELIYEKYSSLQKLLDIVRELKKEKEWSEIAAELKRERNIKKIDLKKKCVVVDL